MTFEASHSNLAMSALSTDGPTANAGRVLVVGSTMVDLITYTNRMPLVGETVHGTSLTIGCGGKGANQAVMLARLGADVSLVNCVGDDNFGSMTLQNLRNEGVNVQFVRTLPERATGCATIVVEPGGANRIVIVTGANDNVTPDLVDEAFAAFGRVDILVCQLEIAAPATLRALEQAAVSGIMSVLNPAPAGEFDLGVLGLVSWLIPNESEFADIVGLAGWEELTLEEAAIALARRCKRGVVVTLGERGAVLARNQGSEVITIPTPRVEAVDTTGAGDAFVGAFAFGLANAMDEESAVELACRCASTSVTRRGTQSSFPVRGELSTLLNTRGGPRRC